MPAGSTVLAIAVLAAGCANGAPSGQPVADQVAVAKRATPDEVTEIRWFVGLGTGVTPKQVEVQQRVVDEFNATHPGTRLILEAVDHEIAYEILADRIAQGTAPDIIGPVGINGASTFGDQLMDLEQFIVRQQFDLARYDAEQLETWRNGAGSLTAIPLGVSPSFLYYNRELFDRAGLAYPPHEFGELYEGEPWTMERLYRLSQQLTLDAAGRDGLDPDFDPSQAVQWGFTHQFGSDPQSYGSFFGAGSLVSDSSEAQVPQAWLEAWRWYYSLIWGAHAAPNEAQINSALLDRGNTFASGNIAIAFTHLWYTGSLGRSGDPSAVPFDLAVVPSFNGVVTSKIHADALGILTSTEHPDEAFQVLTYLLEEAAGDLLDVYGMFPAEPGRRKSFFDNLDQDFPQDVDWSIVEASLAYPDVPSHQSALPNHIVARGRLTEFAELLLSDPTIDIDVEAERLRLDLGEIFTQVAPS